MNRIRTALAAFALPLAILTAPAPATGEEPEPKPVGDLHAYGYHGTDCETDPGFIGINYAEGASWTIEGERVDVTPPASRFYFPDGIQAEVTATALPGYRIDPSVRSTFYIQVFPCPPAPPSCEERLEQAEQTIADQAGRIDRMRERLERLRERLERLRPRR